MESTILGLLHQAISDPETSIVALWIPASHRNPFCACRYALQIYRICKELNQAWAWKGSLLKKKAFLSRPPLSWSGIKGLLAPSFRGRGRSHHHNPSHHRWGKFWARWLQDDIALKIHFILHFYAPFTTQIWTASALFELLKGEAK